MTRTAAELCAYHEIQLRSESRGLLRPEWTPRQFFDLLMDRGHYADARRVLAHALSRRRALWWGCLCAGEAYAVHAARSDREALAAVAHYVTDNSESGRRVIEALIREFPADTPAGCLLMAAFFSGGNTSRPGLPFVPPKPFVTGRLVGVAVYLASVWNDPACYLDHLRRYLKIGLELARGPNPWSVRQSAVGSRQPPKVSNNPRGTFLVERLSALEMDCRLPTANCQLPTREARHEP